MRARYAMFALAALFGAPGSASAADVSIDQTCYVEGKPIVASGSGYTPNSTATLTLADATYSADTDATGAFSTTITAPASTLKHPGAQQYGLSVRDAGSGAETSTSVNVAKIGVDAFPVQAKPHSRITWYLAGFPSQKAIYGHWRFGGRTRANHRMGRPQGPCGVLKVRARQIEAAQIRFGIWTVQFDHNRTYDAHAVPRVSVRINVYRTFG